MSDDYEEPLELAVGQLIDAGPAYTENAARERFEDEFAVSSEAEDLGQDDFESLRDHYDTIERLQQEAAQFIDDEHERYRQFLGAKEQVVEILDEMQTAASHQLRFLSDRTRALVAAAKENW